MNQVLNLKTVKVGETVSGDYVYVSEYKEITYAEGTKSFIAGTFVLQGATLAFKIWDSALLKIFKENEISGAIVAVSGLVKEYKGVLELNVQAVDFNPDCKDKSLFLKSVDVEKVFGKFSDFLNTNISSAGISCIMAVFQGESLFERFKQEYAGSKMHDAQIGGLMNHEYKMLNIAKAVVDNDDRISDNTLFKDLLYTGIVFHDIGKLKEMNNGQYTENSYVTHIVFGIEILSKYKDVFCKVYNENFYYQLLAIIQGHHGEFGDSPKTPLAYIVHLIDMLDSKTTMALDRYESGNVLRGDNGSISYVDNNWRMVYPCDAIMQYKKED